MIPILLAITLSILFILVFSSSTSPLSYYYNGDTVSPSITIARGWYYDFVPYKDLFAQDAPWMYWICKIGVSLAHGNKTGIAIIQVINLFLFLLSIYFISLTISNNKYFHCFTLLAITALLKINYTDGIYPQEFLLPTYGWLIYFFLTRDSHIQIKSFFIGICLGITCVTIPQAIILYLPFVFMFLFSILKRKKYQSFFISLILLILSSTLIILPFIIYFKQQNCFSEMIQYIFHTDKNMNFIGERTSYFYKKFFIYRFPTISLLFTSLLCLFKKKYFNAITYACASILQIYVFYQLFLTEHYSMFLVSNSIVLIIEIYEFLPNVQTTWKQVLIPLLCSLLPIYYLITSYYPLMSSRIYSYQNIYHNEGWEGLLDNIDSEDFDSLVFYGTPSLNNAYLNSNEMPVYKYFYEQDDLIQDNEDLKEDILNTFNTLQAKWIITNKVSPLIQDILDAHYALVEKTGMYYIYLLRQ